jgi:type IV pilus assembly protein PilE
MKNQANGFTLIELMIVLAIIAILSLVAYPSYQNQMEKVRRGEGVALLNEIMQAQEREFVDARTYRTDLTLLGYGADPVVSENGYYQVAAAACGANALTVCIQLTATGIGVQAGTPALTLNSRGTSSGF